MRPFNHLGALAVMEGPIGTLCSECFAPGGPDPLTSDPTRLARVGLPNNRQENRIKRHAIGDS